MLKTMITFVVLSNALARMSVWAVPISEEMETFPSPSPRPVPDMDAPAFEWAMKAIQFYELVKPFSRARYAASLTGQMELYDRGKALVKERNRQLRKAMEQNDKMEYTNTRG